MISNKIVLDHIKLKMNVAIIDISKVLNASESTLREH